MATATLDQALQVFGKLSVEDQEIMLEIARSRRIEAWRKETATHGKKALADSRAGKLKGYSAVELVERLRGQWERPIE